MPHRPEPRIWQLVPPPPTAPWADLIMRCPAEFRIVWRAAVEKAHRDGIHHPVPEIEAFQILEMLVADYLAGP